VSLVYHAAVRLTDIVTRVPPVPWAEGDNIPWSDPGFSRRMLAEHLSDAHDAASRRPSRIDAHVAWLHREILGGRAERVLDLGCGPGLYTERLARLGHRCVGIDWSPASIEHAVTRARESSLAASYVLSDLRKADFGEGFGLVMLVYGELNVFRPADAREIVTRARAALTRGGALVLESHTRAAVEAIGARPPLWRSLARGLFSDRPHLWLEESSWDAAARAATRRHFVVDAASGEVTRYAASYQAYSEAEYRELLLGAGSTEVATHPSLAGAPESSQSDFAVWVARG